MFEQATCLLWPYSELESTLCRAAVWTRWGNVSTAIRAGPGVLQMLLKAGCVCDQVGQRRQEKRWETWTHPTPARGGAPLADG